MKRMMKPNKATDVIVGAYLVRFNRRGIVAKIASYNMAKRGWLEVLGIELDWFIQKVVSRKDLVQFHQWKPRYFVSRQCRQ